MKLLCFIAGLLLGFPLFAYNNCLNEETISEQCIRDLVESKEFVSAAKYIYGADFASKTDRNILKTEILFQLSDYSGVEKSISSLPNNIKNTLYYKAMSAKSFIARKRFNQALEIIDEIKSAYPVYYLFSDFECLKGDIALYRKQYDSATDFYDRCLEVRDNGIAAYNRILSLEKNGRPQQALLKDYIEYAERYSSLFLKSKVVDRLVELKQSKNFPISSSPYYVRWLSIMRRENRLASFFNDDFLTLSYPANLEIVDFLISLERYSDALKIMDEALQSQQKANDVKYKLVNKKYRILNLAGREVDAADFILKSSEEFNPSQKDRLRFLAALVYFENGLSEKSKFILGEIVAERENSKYFILALYKLGLIYLFEGNDFYAFTLWSDFLSSEKISYEKYVDGKGSAEAIFGLYALIDRINGYCAAFPDWNFRCYFDKNGSEVGNSVISYYDFAYFHIMAADDFKDRTNFEKISDSSEKWLANQVNTEASKNDFLEAISQLSAKVKKREPIVMTELFLKSGNMEGVEFYVDMMRIYQTYNEQKHSKNAAAMRISMPETLINEELISNYREALSKIHLVYNKFFKKTAKIASYHYNQFSADLTYSPQDGKVIEWRLLYPTPYLEDVLKLAAEFNVPPQLIYAIMRAETYYRESLS